MIARVLDIVADRARHALSRGIALGIEIALDGLPRDVWIVACAAANVPHMPAVEVDGEWKQAPPEVWAEHMVRHADALRAAARRGAP